jgi:hypothetical protein
MAASLSCLAVGDGSQERRSLAAPSPLVLRGRGLGWADEKRCGPSSEHSCADFSPVHGACREAV